MAEQEPTLIVATSANNQAVTNILQAFAEVKEPVHPLAGRWLADIASYGLFLPSQAKNIDENFRIHAMQGMGKDARYDAQVYETAAGLAAATQAFLLKAQEAFPHACFKDIDDDRALLHRELKAKASLIESTISALNSLVDALGDGVDETTNLCETHAVLRAAFAPLETTLA